MGKIKNLWARWKIIAEKVGNFQARILLTAVYFTIFMPYGFIVRFFLDPLHIKKMSNTNWITRSLTDDTLESVGRQF